MSDDQPESSQAVEIVQQPGIIAPAGSLDDMLEAFEQYQKMKTRLAGPGDFVEVGGKQHPNKSFVRKVQRFFNLSVSIRRDEPWVLDGEMLGWLAVARATHDGTGAYQESDGACTFEEKTEGRGGAPTLHNVRAHAITRAKNRAVLDLVGFGDVSAEELPSNERQQPARRQRGGPRSQQAAAAEGVETPRPARRQRPEAQALKPEDVIDLVTLLRYANQAHGLQPNDVAGMFDVDTTGEIAGAIAQGFNGEFAGAAAHVTSMAEAEAGAGSAEEAAESEPEAAESGN